MKILRITLHPRRVTIRVRTSFTTSPTGRVFNSRFSARFKKS